MEDRDFPNLEVGQLAEMKTFEEGFRGAWFRCKIREISPEKDKIRPEYYDFPDEEIMWTEIFQVPSYGKRLMHIKKQLMVRPQYPPMYHKDEKIPVTSTSDVCVVVDGTWKVGDTVDWFEEQCYWSGRVIKILSDDKVQIQLPLPPVGEGEMYEASCKNLRPSLEWSPSKSWTLLAVDGQISRSARLVFPSKQDKISCPKDVPIAAASPLHTSSSSRVSINAEEEKPDTKIASEEVKATCSDSISSSHVKETKVDTTSDSCLYHSVPLNMLHEDTLEAPIRDLEELANKVKWIKSILQRNRSTSSWKFVEDSRSC